MSKSKKWIEAIFEKSMQTSTSTTFSPEESPTDQDYPNYDEEGKLIVSKEPEYISKYNGEKVLVFKKELLTEELSFQGMLTGEKSSKIKNKILVPENLFYIDRDIAENDLNYKQVIPYCIFTKNDQLFVYQRSKHGSENRLHDLWSVGVGGHVNPCDGNNIETIGNACKREIEEEVQFSDPHSVRLVGVINDDSSTVNAVHFGVVFHVHLKDGTSLNPIDKALANGEFKHTKTTVISDINWEDWSVHVIRNYLRN
jgi:predicted NUDIX family phosphoesterase